jgi:hypothetical protein
MGLRANPSMFVLKITVLVELTLFASRQDLVFEHVTAIRDTLPRVASMMTAILSMCVKISPIYAGIIQFATTLAQVPTLVFAMTAIGAPLGRTVTVCRSFCQFLIMSSSGHRMPTRHFLGGIPLIHLGSRLRSLPSWVLLPWRRRI